MSISIIQSFILQYSSPSMYGFINPLFQIPNYFDSFFSFLDRSCSSRRAIDIEYHYLLQAYYQLSSLHDNRETQYYYFIFIKNMRLKRDYAIYHINRPRETRMMEKTSSLHANSTNFLLVSIKNNIINTIQVDFYIVTG